MFTNKLLLVSITFIKSMILPKKEANNLCKVYNHNIGTLIINIYFNDQII